jgi:hypothetical protein
VEFHFSLSSQSANEQWTTIFCNGQWKLFIHMSESGLAVSIPNVDTLQAIDEALAGRNLHEVKDVDELFDDPES